MYFQDNLFAQLAARTRGDDVDAQKELRHNLENALLVIVRQTLRAGNNTTPMGRRILAVARRVEEEGGYFSADEFEHAVASIVSEDVISRLKPSSDRFCTGDSVHLSASEATLVMA